MAISSELREDGIRVVTMNAPPVNALTVQQWFDVADALDEAGADPATKVVILRMSRVTTIDATGAGGYARELDVASEQAVLTGLAPFVIVSGAAVHPRETRFVEAVEMRRALIERYGVPAHAIVIEPYARHTTTNLRNSARLLMSMKAPMDRDALVLSDPRHIDAVESSQFVARNQRELGYQPGKIGKRTSPFDIVFRPSPDSARIDPLDPLDP